MTQFVVYEKLMGCAFSLGVLAQNQREADYFLQMGVAEIQRIEKLLSLYQDTSATTAINRQQAHQALLVDAEVLQLLVRCRDIATLTQGYFDITAEALKQIYSFKGENIVLPTKTAVQEARAAVGFDKLKINAKDGTLTKLKPNMRLSFNAVGKGYAADAVQQLWRSNGVTSGFINASGDMCAFGAKADNTPWQVGIAHPDNKNTAIVFMPLRNQAIATSGDYEQYFIHNGKRFSHNINPITGKPLQGLKSVSVLSPSAELSDALATAVYAMGAQKGMVFINALPQTHAIIINENNHVLYSKHLQHENTD